MFKKKKVPGAKDDKGTDANPQAMFWLVEAMIKAEDALKELLQLADFKTDCLPSIQVLNAFLFVVLLLTSFLRKWYLEKERTSL